MNITRNNYEQYFLDFFEGSLDATGQGLLMAFLEQQPDLKEEFDSFRMVTLTDDTLPGLGNKDFLKKPVIGQANADTFFAAHLEGDLTPMQQREMEAFLAQHPQKNHDLELMRQTVLVPDLRIGFPRKSSLKRHTINPIYRKLWYATSVAAVVLVMAGLFFTWSPTPSPTEIIARMPVPMESMETAPLRAENPETDILVPEGPVEQGSQTPGVSAQPSQRPVASPSPVPTTPAPTPQPLLASRMQGRSQRGLAAPEPLASEPMEQRTEFAYWSHALLTEKPIEENIVNIPGQAPRSTTLGSLAFNRLQAAIPDEVKEVEERISDGRLSLRSIAGVGLAGISNLLNMERDENGKLVQVAVGDIEFSRK